MDAITLPSYLTYGISVYVPAVSDVVRGYLTLTITYSYTSQLYRNMGCNDPLVTLWTNQQTYSGSPIRFDYIRTTTLALGSYHVSLSLLTEKSTTLKGSQVYTIDQPTDTLYIGVPYSIYSAISLAQA